MESRFLICALAIAMAGALFDVRSKRVPNWLTYSGILLALAARLSFTGFYGFESGVESAIVGGGAMLLLFFAGGVGGGDVKLMAAVCAWAGAAQVIVLMLASAISGGVLAAGALIVTHSVGRTLRNSGELVLHHMASGIQPHPTINVYQPGTLRVPFGLAIAMGTFYCAASGIWWR